MVYTLPIDNNPPTQTPSLDGEPGLTSQTTEDTSSNFLGRVMNYPSVNSLIDTAKGYYTYAKDSNDYVKKSLDSIESNIKSVVTPVLENEMVKKMEKPLDNMACRQLDKMEKLQEDYKPTYDYVVKKVSDLAETGVQAVEPIDQYLKNSYLATPVNVAVNITESIVEKYIPTKEEEKTKSEDTTTTNEPGPIFKSGAIAKKLQKEAMSKLSNLNLRETSTVESYHYVVNLIEYAAKNLDQQAHQTMERAQSGYNMGYEYVSQQGPILKEKTTEKVQNLTNDALVAVINAIEVISAKLPENVTNASTSVYRQITNIPVIIESANSDFYTQLSTKSSEKLKELGNKISQTLESSGGTLPIQLLQNARDTLYGIYESYMPSKDKTTTISPTKEVNQ